MVFDTDVPLLPGFKVVVHHQQIAQPGSISKLVSILDRATGAVTRANPRCVTRNTTAVIELKVEAALCVDPFRVCKEMGRILLRAAGRTIAAGVVLDPAL